MFEPIIRRRDKSWKFQDPPVIERTYQPQSGGATYYTPLPNPPTLLELLASAQAAVKRPAGVSYDKLANKVYLRFETWEEADRFEEIYIEYVTACWDNDKKPVLVAEDWWQAHTGGVNYAVWQFDPEYLQGVLDTLDELKWEYILEQTS